MALNIPLPVEMAFIGNVGFNVTESSALQGVTMKVETWEASFSEYLWDCAQEYDFWEINDGYPDPGLVTPELLYDGAMKRITNSDYRHASGDVRTMSGVFYDVVVDIRMLYEVFTVEVPAGETVTISVVYAQLPSTDTGGPKAHREGYDMATRLGSNLNFTEQTSSVTNSQLIKIVDQNFGFDLEKNITVVTLDMGMGRYYLDVAVK